MIGKKVLRLDFGKIRIKTLETKLEKLNNKLAILLKEDTDLNLKLDALTIQYEQYQRNIMEKRTFINKNGVNLIERDEVMNNPEQIDKEYDITCDQTTGKVWIASTDGEVIIQGCITGYLPKNEEHPIPGAEFVYVNGKPSETKPGTKEYNKVLFSGSIYFDELPLEVFDSLITSQKPEVKDEVKNEEKKPSINPRSELKPTGSKETINIPELPSLETLRKLPAGQLKPPKCSRQEKRLWNQELRRLYPDCFDSGGNWGGYVDSGATTDTDIQSDKSLPEDVEPDKNKEIPAVDMGRGAESVRNEIQGLIKSTGAGNTITNMTDPKITNGFFLGRHFGKKGYAMISTPAKQGKFEESAYIICNKEKTAKFMLAGLARSSSFNIQVDGADPFHIRSLKEKFFLNTPENKKTLVYWVTNAVTALQALGTQEKDIQDIASNISS